VLEDVVAAVGLDFAAQRIQCDVRFDSIFEFENATPPRIVVIPTTDRFGPPIQVQAAGVLPQNARQGANPRPLWTRHAGATALIWAAGVPASDEADQLPADYKALGVLLNQFVASLHRLVPGFYTLEGGGVDQDTPVSSLGKLYRLQFSVQVPVTAAPWIDVSGVVRQFTVQELDRSVEVGVP
jgi:hypothetical protein